LTNWFFEGKAWDAVDADCGIAQRTRELLAHTYDAKNYFFTFSTWWYLAPPCTYRSTAVYYNDNINNNVLQTGKFWDLGLRRR
jgi:hypothetical protein